MRIVLIVRTCSCLRLCLLHKQLLATVLAAQAAACDCACCTHNCDSRFAPTSRVHAFESGQTISYDRSGALDHTDGKSITAWLAEDGIMPGRLSAFGAVTGDSAGDADPEASAAGGKKKRAKKLAASAGAKVVRPSHHAPHYEHSP